MKRRQLLAGVVLALVAACASGPRYDTAQVDSSLTPAKAATSDEFVGRRVLWGGVIVAVRNLAETTEMELLAYPLNDDQRPQTDQPAAGRFLVRHPGYLEAVDYAPGRRLTVLGTLQKRVAGKVDEAPYTYPVLTSEQLYLWPRDSGQPSEPQFHFGIGVIFGG